MTDRDKLIEELNKQEFVYRTDAEWHKKQKGKALAARKAGDTAKLLRKVIDELSAPEKAAESKPLPESAEEWINK